MNRRLFLVRSVGVVGGAALARGGRAVLGREDRAGASGSRPATAPAKTVTVDAASGDELQKVLDAHSATGGVVRLRKPTEVTCRVREATIARQVSPHALLVPPDVHLDLGGGKLLLDLRSNSYGVRLSSRSAIRNGTIRIVRSEGKGSQAAWHSAISVGAAYGDGGTPERPGPFCVVSDWAIEDITIDQPFEAAAIQLMSEAHHGIIRDIRVLDSDKALLGIGLDWGSVGPIATADAELPKMRRLWDKGMIFSTHPHDILIEKIRVGRLGRNVDGNDAGVRCSACHNITIRDVQVESAATGVAIFGGDCGYEYAPEKHRELAHSGYVIDGLVIRKALRFGIVLNGSADNIHRARFSHGYDAVRDPVHPGVHKPVIRNSVLRGGFTPKAQGVYAVAVTDATIENIDVSEFEKGIHVEDWVRGMRFRGGRIAGNKQDLAIEGTVEPPTGITFDGVSRG